MADDAASQDADDSPGILSSMVKSFSGSLAKKEEENKEEENKEEEKNEESNGTEKDGETNSKGHKVLFEEPPEEMDTARRSSTMGSGVMTRRKSHLDTLMETRRKSLSKFDSTSLHFSEDTLMEEIEDEEEEEGKEGMSESQLRRISLRVSSLHEQLGSDRLVEVRMRDVSYHVPVRVDAPSVKTVWNQTFCYSAYRFFRRVHMYRIWKETKQNLTNVAWKPQSSEDIFMPYRKKTILSNINLVLKPGSSYLILGPPGCGKTSLLKAIAGSLPGSKTDATKDKPYFEGRVEYNGLASQDDGELVLPNICSYVQQSDNHAARLTVKETFDFAFQCRTGGSRKDSGAADSAVGSKLDLERVTENLTLDGLGLAHVADTFVGDDDIRGVSGGQRRRVTVGEMMQGQSPVACADEISTGLDAAVTYDICRSIVTFAKAAKTTRVVALLQPGPEVFSLFDEVIILSDGHLVYAGPIGSVVGYFENLGYVLPATVDVADFLQSLPTPDGALFLEDSKGEAATHMTAEQFAEAFRKSPLGECLVNHVSSPHPIRWKPSHDDSSKDEEKALCIQETETPGEFKIEFQNSFMRSFKLNLNRHITLWKRDKGFIIGKAFENIGMAVATGGILFGQANVTWDDDDQINSETSEKAQKLMFAVYGALYMASFHITQGTSTSAPDEMPGRAIHYKHADANFYQSLSFAVARLVSTFPQRAIDITAFGLPVYWMVGLTAEAGAFFVYLLLLLWLIIAEKILFGIVVAILKTKQDVLGVGSFLVLMQVLFGGFIVYPGAIPDYYLWAYYINPLAWAYQGLVVNEFTTSKYREDGDDLLSSRGFETGRGWIGYAFCFLIPFSIIGSLLLGLALKYVRIVPKKAGTGSSANADDAEEEYDADTFSLPFTPVDLTFENISYEVQTSTGNERLRILNDVSGSFRAGRMCALMGSSGAGKTTLMDVVAMRKESGEITGDIRLNGFEQERISFLRSSGYVEQFDIQTPQLTVHETVLFSARLRLDSENPATAKDEDKIQFVDSILRLLELTPIEKYQVGSYEEGGLTFEQRKRLAIAVELAGSPSILFLDEPTSGLDARAAVLVVRLLKRIADTGRTVCSTVHQPSSAVFEMFDDLMLLKTGGRVVYFGELGKGSVHLIDYFESKGASPIEHGENPSSWMLRALDEKPDWEDVYTSSSLYETLETQIQELNESPDETKKIVFDSQYATKWKYRFHLMFTRINRIYLRSPAYNLTRVMISVLYAFILGSVFLQQSIRGNTWRENQVEGVLGVIFLSLTAMGVTCITMVVPVMKAIRDVFYKHRASGMIEQSPLTLALSIGEAPYICVISVLFGAVFYGTVGLFHGTQKFALYWVFFVLNLATYSYFGQAFMCLVKDVPTAGALMGALIGYNVFFSGFVVKPQYFVGPFQLGYWTAPGRFAYEGIIVTQFTDVDLNVTAQENSPWFFSLNCTDGKTEPCVGTMDNYVGFAFGGRFTDDNIWFDFFILLGYVCLSWMLTAVALKKFNYVNT